jgi:hypothetical protein
MMDPPQPQVVPKDKWFTPPAKPPSSAEALVRGPSSQHGGDRAA